MTDSGNPSVLVQRLHQARIKRGLTVQQMAERCGLPKSSLESYMKMEGAKRPGVDALISIANGLDVSIDWLVGRSADSFSARLTKKDYSLACFSVVQELLLSLRKKQRASEGSIFRPTGVVGHNDAEVAARSMLIFLETVELFEANEADLLERGAFAKRMKALLGDRKPETE